MTANFVSGKRPRDADSGKRPRDAGDEANRGKRPRDADDQADDEGEDCPPKSAAKGNSFTCPWHICTAFYNYY